MFRNTDDGLSDDECVGVYPLVFATHRGLACAAGQFLYHMYVFHHDIITQYNSPPAFHSLCVCVHVHVCVSRLCSVSDEESGNRSDSFLVLLVRFFIDSKVNPHPSMHCKSLH